MWPAVLKGQEGLHICPVSSSRGLGSPVLSNKKWGGGPAHFSYIWPDSKYLGLCRLRGLCPLLIYFLITPEKRKNFFFVVGSSWGCTPVC